MIKAIWSKVFPKKVAVKVGDYLKVDWKGTRGKNKVVAIQVIKINKDGVSVKPFRAKEM